MKKELIIKSVILAIISVLILSALIAVAVGMPDSETGIVMDNNGAELPTDKVNKMPSGLRFAAAAETYAETSVTVTATVKPANASNKNLNWSIVWVNAADEWATGKNIADYLTVSSADNIATITCKQPFGAQAKLVAVSQANENAKAECLIDFQARIESYQLDIYATVNGVTTKLGTAESHESSHDQAHSNPSVKIKDLFKYQTIYKFVPVIKFGVGTIKDSELQCTSAYLNLSSSFRNEYKKQGGHEVSNTVPSVELNGNIKDGYITADEVALASILINHSIANNDEIAILNKVIASGNCVFEVYLFQVQVGSYHETYVPFCFGISPDYAYTAVNGVEFNMGNVQF